VNAPQSQRLFSLDDEKYRSRLTDVQHFVPGNAIAAEAAPRLHVDLANTEFIRNLHSSAGYCVSEVRRVKVSLMPHGRWKCATQNSLFGVLMQMFTDRSTFPPRRQRVRQRVWQRWRCGTGSKCASSKTGAKIKQMSMYGYSPHMPNSIYAPNRTLVFPECPHKRIDPELDDREIDAGISMVNEMQRAFFSKPGEAI
jgi:hypothetical protein